MSRYPTRRLIRSRPEVAAIAIGLLAALGACEVAQPGQFDATPVYQAIVDAVRDSAHGKALLVMDNRIWSPERGVDEIRRLDVPRSTREAYRLANVEASPVPAERLDAEVLDGTFRFRLELDAAGLEEWWHEIRARYGPGDVWVLSVSHPGFSPDGASAVVQYNLDCGSLCGYAHVAELELKHGHWSVIRDSTYAIS